MRILHHRLGHSRRHRHAHFRQAFKHGEPALGGVERLGEAGVGGGGGIGV